MDYDVDNFRTCFNSNDSINNIINLKANKGIEFDFNEKIDFVYDKQSLNPIGDVCKCWGCTAFIINEKCFDILENDSRIYAQYIRFNKNFNLLNNLKIISNLDLKKTSFDYFDDDIIGVKKFSFIKDDFPPLFQIKLPNNLVIKDYFVTKDFIKIVEDNNLKGFLFEEIWNG